MQLSKYFTSEQFTRSGTAARLKIDNELPAHKVSAARYALGWLDRIQDMFGAAVVVHSGYRCPEVNKAVGSGPYSQHLTAEAIDFHVMGVPLKAVFDAIRLSKLPFDQLIFESPNETGGWIHVSFAKSRQPRRSILVAHFTKGRRRKTHYSKPDWKPTLYARPLTEEGEVSQILAMPISVTSADTGQLIADSRKEDLSGKVFKMPGLMEKSDSENLPGSPELYESKAAKLRQKLQAGGMSAVSVLGGLWGLIHTGQFWFIFITVLLALGMIWFVYHELQRYFALARK